LKGLDDQYSPFCSHIMLKDPLSNIYKVYFLLVQQESQVVLPLDESKFLLFVTIIPMVGVIILIVVEALEEENQLWNEV
jgi:hypothetical protein